VYGLWLRDHISIYTISTLGQAVGYAQLLLNQ